jgi:hypothetical protein
MAGEYAESLRTTTPVNTPVAKSAPTVTPKATPKPKPKAKVSAAPAPTPIDFAKQYGVQAALVNSTPELKDLFNRAVTGKWDPNKFNAELINTNWFKTHSDTWRTAEAARVTDPASWTEQLNATSDLIRQTAVSMGFELDDTQVANLANQSLYLSGGSSNNIDFRILKTHVAETGRVTGQGGDALKVMDNLKNFSYAMGVSYNDDWYSNAAKNIATGDGTIDAWNKQIKDIAKSKYAAFSDQIDAGATVMQVASPYINSMANILEINPTDVKLDDPTINRALTNLGQDSKPALQPLWQFEQEMRKDPRWGNTQNARQSLDSTANTILKSFGLVS